MKSFDKVKEKGDAMKKSTCKKILYTIGFIILLIISIISTIFHWAVVSGLDLRPVMFMDPIFLIKLIVDPLSKFIPLFTALELLGVNSILWIIGVWINNKKYHEILLYLTYVSLIVITIMIWYFLNGIVR